MRSRRTGSLIATLVVGFGTVVVVPMGVSADTTPGTLPFAQDWSNVSLITGNDDWAGVPSIIGYRGDGMATVNIDPQSVIGDGSTTPVNGLAQSSATSATGGIHEIEASQVVALQGSGTADAPHLVVRLNTTGQTAVNVAYTLVDLDADNGGSQQFALHYRIGGSGAYTNVAAGYVPDASAGQGDTFAVTATLPAAADDQPIVDVRIMTTDTVGSDSMTGVDDVVVTGTPGGGPASPVSTCPATLVTPAGTPASADVSATDADSTIASIAITSPAVDGITLTPTGAGTATLDVAGTTAAGTYDVVIEFGTDDDPPQATSCTIAVTVQAAQDVTLVSAVQGDGTTSPLVGDTVTVEAVVTSLFTNQDAADGFFLQEEDADADASAATSEGLFVFCRGACPSVVPGELVRVRGVVAEFFGMTQIDARPSVIGSIETLSTGNPRPSATTAMLPAAGSTRAESTFEPLEGMIVTFPGTLVVSEYFELARYGHIVLTADARPFQFTHDSAPSVAGYETFLADLASRRIILDDDNNDQNDAVSGPVDEAYPWPAGGLSTGNRVRGGDTIVGLTGVMHWSFAGQTGTDAWRIRPIADEDYTFTAANPAPASPGDVGGDLKVASFNVLNYFTTIDTTPSNTSGPCGPNGVQDCRGADSAAELERQRDKIASAIATIDADVVGLIEIENDEDQSAQDLVDALNAATAAGTYASINTGFIGSDAIKVAFIYQPGSVTPVGDFAILDSSVDAEFVDTENRPALIQTFEQVGTGERFTAAINHLKSKGSDCDALGDPDLGDGQANCSVTRTRAAQALANYLASDPTGSGDPDVLILGDLNSYRMEAPIAALEAAGYTDLLDQFVGEDAYTYLFDGQLGYLDHALANESLLGQVTGTTGWAINADEIPLFDYNDDVLDAGEAAFERESTALPIYAADALRSSDHDPVIVGLDLDGDDGGGGGALRLTLLHNNDGESALLPVAPRGGIARFSTLVAELRAEADAEPGNAGSLLVSSGDNFLAGPQLQASLENYDGDTDYSDDGPFYDVLALDRLAFDASAVGNHEFDFGPDVLGYYLSQFDTSNIRFVSANLDVTGDDALAQFIAASPGEAGTLVEWTRTEVEGVSVAIVGATTPRLPSISSPGPDVIVDDDVLGAVQGAIDAATADGTDVVILISHLQNIAEDQALIAELTDLDIAVAGGGDELLANPDDVLLPSPGPVFGPYPLVQEAADGAAVPIVTTQGSYGYLGRLIVDFDADGMVVAIDDRSGPVRNVFDPASPPADQRDPDPFVLANIEAPVAEFVAELQADTIAFTEPILDGLTSSVRTMETNLGSLFADALRITAEAGSPAFGATRPTVAITNSGGIRNNVVLGPNEDITRFDTFQIAPFSNFVAFTTDVSPEQLKQLLEHSVSANLTPAGSLQAEGRFGQLSGIELVYDPSQPAQQVVRNPDGTVAVTSAGSRVRQLTITLNDTDPSNDVVVVRNGAVVPGAPSVDLVSNSFTIANGDNYPFNLGQGDFTNLPASYQQSLEEFLVALGTVTAAAYPEGGLGRIVVGGDIAENVLTIDEAVIVTRRNGGGTVALAGSAEGAFAACPPLDLRIEGVQVVDVNTTRVGRSTICLSLTNKGALTFNFRTGEIAAALALPNSFTLVDNTVEFTLAIDGAEYVTERTGRRIGLRWIAD